MMSSVVERSHSMSDRVGSSMGMRDGCRDRMVRSGVDSVVSHWVGGVDGVTGGDGFGKEGVQQRVGVQSVERGSFSTVDRVPCLTSEEVLVKQGSVWTNEAGTVGSVSAILTHSVGLTSGLDVGVHAWTEGGGGAGEGGVGGLGQAGIVLAGVAGHSVLVMVRLVVRFRVVGWLWLVVGRGWVVVSWLWNISWSWFVSWLRNVGWNRGWLVGGLWSIDWCGLACTQPGQFLKELLLPRLPLHLFL